MDFFYNFIFNITNKLTWKSVTSQSLEFLQNITKEIKKNFAAVFFVQVLDCINKMFFGGFVAMNMMADY